MISFKDRIKIIGVNPFVIPPERVLTAIFAACGRKSGPIRIAGTLNGHPYKQTLVKFAGAWRLYLNTPMRRAAGIDVGDMAEFTVEYDPTPRGFAMRPELKAALAQHPDAKRTFDALPPSRREEIVRYIARLKSTEVVERNVARAIRFLLGEGRFVGRDKP